MRRPSAEKVRSPVLSRAFVIAASLVLMAPSVVVAQRARKSKARKKVRRRRARKSDKPGARRRMPLRFQTNAGRLLSTKRAPRGRLVDAKPGDYFMEGGGMTAVLRSEDGVMIDLATSGGRRGSSNIDRLRWARTELCDSLGSHAIAVRRVAINGASTELVVIGEAIGGSRLDIRTTYRLVRPGRLEIGSWVSNIGDKVRFRVAICDDFSLEAERGVWLAGDGAFARTRRGWATGRWVSQRGDGWGLLIEPAGPMSVAWSHRRPPRGLEIYGERNRRRRPAALLVRYASRDLKPGERFFTRRGLSLHRGSVASSLARLLASKAISKPKRPAMRVVHIAFKGGARPPDGSHLLVLDATGPLLSTPLSELRAPDRAKGTAGGDGRGASWRLSLPRRPLKVAVELDGVGRGPIVELGGRATTLQLTPPAHGTVHIDVSDEHGRPAAAIMRAVRLPQTGAASGAASVAVAIDGAKSMALAAGRYQLTISRGLRYRRIRRPLTVVSGRLTKLALRLSRPIAAPGWFAADFNLHARKRRRSSLLAARARGLDAAVVSSLNRVAAPTNPSGRGRLLLVGGAEIATRGHRFGRFTLFPLDANRVEIVPATYEQTTPRQLFAAARSGGALIQVNHPRDDGAGYFDHMQLRARSGRASPHFSNRFDLLEIYNGRLQRAPAAVERNLRDWFALLDRGQRHVATGGVDRAMPLAANMPRTLLYAPELAEKGARAQPTKEILIGALRARRAVVTNGPVIELSIGREMVIGARVPATKGGLALRVRVWAAPRIDVDRVELVENSRVIQRWSVRRSRRALRLDRRVSLKPRRTSWYVIVARGPRQPAQRYPVTFAVTNPLWVERKAAKSR